MISTRTTLALILMWRVQAYAIVLTLLLWGPQAYAKTIPPTQESRTQKQRAQGVATVMTLP